MSQSDNTYIVHASQTTNHFHFLKMIHAVTSWGVWLAKLDSTELTSHYTSPCFPWQSFCWSTGPCPKPPPLHRLCPLPERLHQYQERLVSPRGRMWWWRDRGHSANCQGCRSVFFIFFYWGGGVSRIWWIGISFITQL